MDPRARRAWQPLLDGERADRARAVIDAITSELDGDPVAAGGSPSLLDGAAGRALVFAYLDRAWPERGHAQRAARWLDAAIDRLAEQPMPAGLYAGFTGVAWVVEHLGGGCDADDAAAAIDDALLEQLRGAAAGGLDHDLIGGLAGLGAYALERLPRASGAALLALVVDRLGEAAEPHGGGGGSGGGWRTAPERMLPETRAEHPAGYLDMGVAHGAPGPIAILAGACAAGVAAARARPLLDGAWRWMMANQLPLGEGSAFPLWRCTDRPARPARSAWCYGDPGAARAMFVAARALGDDARAGDALAIARRALERPRDRTGCRDPGLCHGAAGLAHLANRTWQDTGDPAFADAARAWYEEALAMPRPDEASFLTGTAGLALALAAALAPVEPAWDRVLLISLPPAP